ncbi:MAG: restriction endonuclease subunit S [Alphaproteobacteria bacterium]|nr:restriction endonuclease subunit S [Alphaproteobacteria bacterium]
MNFVELGKVVEIKGGGTPDKSNPNYWGGSIPWASVKDFKSTVIENTIDMITEDGVKNSATNIIPAGSIIVPTRMAVGKAAINKIDMAINQDLKALFPSAGIDTRFLFHCLLANSEVLERQASGATVKGIKLDVLRALQVPVISMKEQKRIAAILDQADALRQSRRLAITRLNDLSQSIFYEMFHPGADDADNEIQLSDYFSEIKMGPFGSLLHKADYIENGIPLINPTHIIDGEIIPDPSFSISPAKAKELHKYLLKEGDIILGRRGDMGRCAVVDGKMEGFLCGTGSMILRPDKSKVDPYFAADLIRSKKVIKEIEAVASGVTMLNLNSKSLNRVFVPKVDRAKQKEYFQKINSLQAKKSYMQESLEKFERLFLSLQQRAFRGEL